MKNVYRVVFLSLILSVFIDVSQLSAQWIRTNGPYMGSVQCFAVVDSEVYVGTVGKGVYRSSDSGATWVQSDSGMESTFANQLAGGKGCVYAGSAIGDGVSLSTDAGRDWKAVNTGLPFDPDPPGFTTGVVWHLAASGGNVFSYIYPPGGYYLSTDSGSNWKSVSFGPITGITTIAVDGNAFVAAGDLGVYISSDSGKTWSSAGLLDSNIISLAVGGNDLYAGTAHQIFRSSNNGANWTLADAGLPDSGLGAFSAYNTELVVSTSNGFYFSSDSGSSWEKMSENGFPLSQGESPDAFVPDGNSILIGYLDYGVYRSTDAGKSWMPSSNGISMSTVSSLVAVRGTVLASYMSYLFRSSDEGASWVPIVSGTPQLALMDSIIYADAVAGVEYSTDDGATWIRPANANPPVGGKYTSLAVGGHNLYLGSEGICGLCDQGGIYLSTNEGASWESKGLSNVRDIAATGSAVYTLYIAGPPVRSLDSGSTWQAISAPVSFFSTDPTEESWVYGGTYEHGAFRSTDYGLNWEPIDSGFPLDSNETVNCFAFDSSDVFVGTDSGVYAANKLVNRWTEAGGPSSEINGPVSALAIGNSDLYAAYAGGVWRFPLSQIITNVETQSRYPVPTSYQLSQNYPNPFNPTTNIEYRIADVGLVTLKVYDVLGQRVATLVDKVEQPGSYEVQFNGSDLASGVYFYRLSAGSYTKTLKLMLLK